MNKYNKLLNNSIVFMIGNFGSRFINFIMVPLYTHVLTTSEYGIVDLMFITVSFLMPILTLEIGQSIIRFSVNSGKNTQEKVFTTALIFITIISFAAVISYPILIYFNVFEGYLLLFLLYLVLTCINNFISQFIRGIGLVKEYAINGILMTIITVISNVVFLLIFDLGIQGYILSMIVASLLSSIYLLNVSGSLSKFKLNFDSVITIDMLRYSVPLIPNSLLLWLNNSATRYFISFFLDTAANGLFAVANKIPNIILTITNVFTQAWQLSSFEEFDSNDKGLFYSKIFRFYSFVLFLACSAIMVILKSFMLIYVSKDFYMAWTLIPVLLLAIIYQSINAFLGTIYTAAKKTRGIFITSFVGAAFSVGLNLLLLPTIGIQGAGVGTLVGYVVMCIMRFFDTKKFIDIQVEWRKFFINNAIVLFQIIILYSLSGIYLLIIQFGMFLILLVNNRSLVKDVLIRIKLTGKKFLGKIDK